MDFYSERFTGEPRFIILTENKNFALSKDYAEDLQEIIDYTYLYLVEDVREVRVGNNLSLALS